MVAAKGKEVTPAAGEINVLGTMVPVPLGYEDKPAYVQWFAAIATLAKFQPDVNLNEEIQEQILGAQTEDDVLGGAVSKAADVKDRPFFITDVKWQKSDYENSPQGLPVYVVLTLRMLDSLEQETLVVGSLNVMNQARRLLEIGAIPSQLPTTLIEKRTSNDFDVLRLVKYTKQLPEAARSYAVA